MIDSGWSRLRRHLVATVIVALGVGLLPLSAALAAPGTNDTRLSGLSMARASVRVGGALWDRVTVSPKAARTVTVQYRRAGTKAFKNASTGRASARGAMTLGLKPPAAGRWQFRAVVAATSQSTRFVSSTRTVVASRRAVGTSIAGFATTSATISLGRTVSDNVGISPRASRVVFVQARRPGSSKFVTVTTGRSSEAGAFSAVYRPTTAGVWQYRLFVRTSATALPATSRTRKVTATGTTAKPTPSTTPAPGDATAPGPVTGLTALATTDTTVEVKLSWANPTDADFTGVMIRRAEGDTAPATASSGTEVVTDTAATATSYINRDGLEPSRQYSYAVFAHDGVPNQSIAANKTVTTKAFPTTTTGAVLSVNELGQPNSLATNKLTVNTPFAFDASGSHAAEGTTLKSGTLAYGDGQADPFTELGPFDFWNTSHSYTDTGLYRVTLTVTDSAGNTDTATVTVNVFDAPKASVSLTSGPILVGEPVTFALDALTSTPDGTELNFYALSFSDHVVLHTPAAEVFHFTENTAPPADLTLEEIHAFKYPGIYTVSFSVANDAGGSTDAEIVIEVLPAL
jgi:PKD domain